MVDILQRLAKTLIIWSCLSTSGIVLGAAPTEEQLLKLIAYQQAKLKVMAAEIKAMRQDLGIGEGAPMNWSNTENTNCSRFDDRTSCEMKSE